MLLISEAINSAILGASRVARAKGGSGRIKVVTVMSEHAAVRDCADYCAEHGFDVAWLPVDAEGCVVMEAAAQIIDDTTILVSVMAVNNETGVRQDLKSLADMAYKHGALKNETKSA